MIHSSSEERIGRPPEAVFDFLADVSNEPVWNPDVINVEATSPPPVGKGSRRRGDYRHIGAVETTVVEYERPHRLAFHATGRQAEMTLDFRFQCTDDGGTHMLVDGTLQLKGPLRFAEGALRAIVARQYAERAGAVKRALDGDGGDE